jgi:SAM-dependent methyltransferase
MVATLSMKDIDYMKRLEREYHYYPVDDISALEIALTAKKYILPRIKNKTVLEMGCGMLTMTRLFLEVVDLLDVVDGAESFILKARSLLESSEKGGEAFCSLFENFIPERLYESIVLANTLHHLHNPSNLLSTINKCWLAPGGELLLVVNNVHSLHRRLGVKLGLLEDDFSATETNDRYCQPGRYSAQSLQEMLVNCGYEATDFFGFYLKPFNYEQMSRLCLTEKELDGLFEIGRDHEEIANLFFVCARARLT